MPNGIKAKRAIKNVARKLRKPAKQVLSAAKREAINQLRGLARSSAMGRLLLTGNGDYKSNGIVSGSNMAQTPSFGTTRITMRHRELVSPIYSSSTVGAFQSQKFTLNPGLPLTFPWLSGISAVFESWKPNGITFEYKALSGTSINSTNTALGEVVMAPQYNPYAIDPTTLVQLEGYSDSVVSVPFDNALCGIECRKSNRQSDALLVRNSNVASFGSTGADSLFDLCDFIIATAGCPGANVLLGELWVIYDIELWNPIIPRFPAGVPKSFQAQFGPSSQIAIVFSDLDTVNDPYGMFKGNSTNSLLMDLSVGHTYLLQFWMQAVSTYTASDISLSLSGCTQVNSSAQCPHFTQPGTVAQSALYFECTVLVNTPLPSIAAVGAAGMNTNLAWFRAIECADNFRALGPNIA